MVEWTDYATLIAVVAIAGFLWGLHRDMGAIHRDIGGLRERMGKLEGLMEGYIRREAKE